MDAGTPRELARIVGQTLMWVHRKRRLLESGDGLWAPVGTPTAEELRRIELCALAARDQVLLARWLGVAEAG